MTLQQVLEWIYPRSLDPTKLDWRRRVIYESLYKRASIWSQYDFEQALEELHPMTCDVSKLSSRLRELYEVRRRLKRPELRYDQYAICERLAA